MLKRFEIINKYKKRYETLDTDEATEVDKKQNTTIKDMQSHINKLTERINELTRAINKMIGNG